MSLSNSARSSSVSGALSAAEPGTVPLAVPGSVSSPFGVCPKHIELRINVIPICAAACSSNLRSRGDNTPRGQPAWGPHAVLVRKETKVIDFTLVIQLCLFQLFTLQ